MSTNPATIIAVTSEDPDHEAVLDRAAALARETGATVVLFDLDADLGPFESPLPTDWSGEGEQEQFGDRLDPNDLETAGQERLADQVRAIRAAGVTAYGWLPPKADAEALAEYAAKQSADVLLVSTEDRNLIEGFRSEAIQVEAVAPRG
jgi:hypothetical protein